MILAIDHVQVAIPRGGEELARAFYGALLGLAETPKPANLAARGGAWFERRQRQGCIAASRSLSVLRAKRISPSRSMTSRALARRARDGRL